MDSKLPKAENEHNKAKADFFQLTKHQLSVNVERYDKALKPSVSLFNMQSYNPSKLQEKPVVFQKRLNSMDSAMLEESAYIALDDPDLKLEKRIENFEQSLKIVDEKIIVAETVKDDRALKELMEQKRLINKNLANLQSQYKSQNLDTKLTNIIAQSIRFADDFKSKVKLHIKLFIRRSKFLHQFTPIARAITVKETLGRLDKINKSVDELVKMKVPFGENEERYETLVNHLQRAGALHSQILKELKG